MPDVSLDYTLTNGLPNDADQVMADLNEIVAALNALTAENFAADAVETAAIKNANVTQAKIAAGATGLAAEAFSAQRATAVSLATGQIVVFDDDSSIGLSAFDVSGRYNAGSGRFLPQLAGIYRVNWCVTGPVLAGTNYWSSVLRLNGGTVLAGSIQDKGGGAIGCASVGTGLVLMNGTTDYLDVIVVHNIGGSQALGVNVGQTFFQGELVGRQP